MFPLPGAQAGWRTKMVPDAGQGQEQKKKIIIKSYIN